MENHINQIENIRDRLNKLHTEWHTTVETYKDHIPDEFFNCTQEYLECVREIETQSLNLEGALRLASFHPYNLSQDLAGFFRRTFLELRVSPLVQAFSTLPQSYVHVAIFIFSILAFYPIHRYAIPLAYFFSSFIGICAGIGALTWVFKADYENELFRYVSCVGLFTVMIVMFLMSKKFLEVVLYITVTAVELTYLFKFLNYVATQMIVSNG